MLLGEVSGCLHASHQPSGSGGRSGGLLVNQVIPGVLPEAVGVLRGQQGEQGEGDQEPQGDEPGAAVQQQGVAAKAKAEGAARE